MIAYFDTSAVVPLLISEPGSETALRMWEEADRVASVRLTYAEARAALAMANRLERLTDAALRLAVAELEVVYEQLDRVDIDDDLVRHAGRLAQDRSLRGYDAVHLAAAMRLADPETILVAGDRVLCHAARTVGLNVSEL